MMHYLRLSAPICLLITACSGEAGNDDEPAPAGTTGNGTSQVAEAYRTSFNRAWESAGEGRSPTQACAGVVGKAAGMLKAKVINEEERTDALAALDACYVRAMERFVNTTLASENPGKTQCISLLKALPVHRSALRGILTEVGEDVAIYDRRLNEKIEAGVRSACPDAANIILGT